MIKRVQGVCVMGQDPQTGQQTTLMSRIGPRTLEVGAAFQFRIQAANFTIIRTLIV